MKSMSIPFRVKATIGGLIAGWAGKVIHLTDGEFWRAWLGNSNFSNENVNARTGLQLSTAWNCVRLISETMSTLPCNVYKTRNGVREVDSDHNLHYILHTQPNAKMTSVVFWQVFLVSMLLWDGAYVEVRRNGDVVTSLFPLLPELCHKDEFGQWWYNDPAKGVGRRRIEEMWYTPAFTLDGERGLSPISMGANVFGGAIAADRAAAETFTHGMKGSGLITVDKILSPEQREQYRQHVKHVNDRGGVYVMEKGTGFSQMRMKPQDAELLASRQFNVEEICRWFRVPPFMVGHGSKDSNWGTGIEQQMMGFITFVLRPYAVRIEQSIRIHLFSDLERRRYTAEFVLEGLLRADSKSRAAYYSVMVQNGIYTRDFCRALENLPPMEGNAALLTVQSNLLPLDKLGEMALAPPKPPEVEDAVKAYLAKVAQESLET